MPRETLAGLSVAWGERPGHGAAVMLIHCSLADHHAWDAVIEALPPDSHVIAPDLTGHGDTGYDPTRPVAAQTVDAYGRLLSRMGGPVHVVGHSYGAVVAMGLALAHAGKVARLTIYEPVLFALLHDAGHPRWTEELALRDGFVRSWEGGPEAAIRHFLARWGNGSSYDDLLPPARAQMDKTIQMVPPADPDLYGPPKGRITLRDLGRLKMPVTAIYGGKSEPLFRLVAELITQNVANGQARELPGAGHLGPLTHPAKMAAMIAGTA